MTHRSFPFLSAFIAVAAMCLAAPFSTSQALNPASRIPEEYRGMTSEQLNTAGLAVHSTKDYGGSAQLFYYATIVSPREARGHFNLACALAQAGEPAAAVSELRAAFVANRTWTSQYLDDPDLDPLRFHPAYSELMNWYAGTPGMPVGAWTGGSLHPLGGQKMPRWLKETPAGSPSVDQASLTVEANNRLEIRYGSAPVVRKLSGESTWDGTTVSLIGERLAPGAKPSAAIPAFGLMTVRRIAPAILHVDWLLSTDDAPYGKSIGEYLGLETSPAAALSSRVPGRDARKSFPGEFSTMKNPDLLSHAGGAIAAQNYVEAARVYFFLSLVDPTGWEAPLGLARSLAHLGRPEEAIHFTKIELANGRKAQNHASLTALDDADFDSLRKLSQWSDIFTSGAGGSALTGSWLAPTGDLPRWMSADDAAPSSASMFLGADGSFRYNVATNFRIVGTYERRGECIFWIGTMKADREETPDSPAPPAQPVSGILEARLVAPDVLSVDVRTGFDGIFGGYFRGQ